MSHDTAVLDAIRAVAEALLPEERPLYDFYLTLLPTLQAHRRALPTPAPPAEAVARLAAGRAALQWHDLAVQESAFLPWLETLVALFTQQDPTVAAEVEVVEPDEWLPLARRWYETGESDAGPTIDALLANALAPYLEQAAAGYATLLPARWSHAACPACGGYPNFALVSGRKPRRTLLCERCTTQWRYPRAGCLYCGEQSPDRFGYFSTEDELYRVEVCDECGYYLKAMDGRHADELRVTPLPEAERIVTPGLDITALEAGYTRPTRLLDR